MCIDGLLTIHIPSVGADRWSLAVPSELSIATIMLNIYSPLPAFAELTPYWCRSPVIHVPMHDFTIDPEQQKPYCDSEKPLFLMLYLIETYGARTGVIIDPYAGTGTTLLASVLYQRSACGCELNPTTAQGARVRLTGACSIDTRNELLTAYDVWRTRHVSAMKELCMEAVQPAPL